MQTYIKHSFSDHCLTYAFFIIPFFLQLHIVPEYFTPLRYIENHSSSMLRFFKQDQKEIADKRMMQFFKNLLYYLRRLLGSPTMTRWYRRYGEDRINSNYIF